MIDVCLVDVHVEEHASTELEYLVDSLRNISWHNMYCRLPNKVLSEFPYEAIITTGHITKLNRETCLENRYEVLKNISTEINAKSGLTV